MQAIKKRHKVVVFAGVFLGRCRFESDAISDARFRCRGAGAFDGGPVVIESPETRVRIRLSHEDCGGPMTAADVGEAEIGLVAGEV